MVNCILLGRAEAFASKNGVFASFLSGLSTGIGFTLALVLLGEAARFWTPVKYSAEIFPEDYGMLLFVLAPGAFIALGYLIAIVNKLRKTC